VPESAPANHAVPQLPVGSAVSNTKRTPVSHVSAAAPEDIWLELLERSDPGCDIASTIDAAGRLDRGANAAQRRKRIPWDED